MDLHLDVGDLTVLMDLKPRFSILDAIDNSERMDWDFLSGLMVEHSSGVSLIAAPESLSARQYGQHTDAILQMLRLLETQFSHIMLDTATSVSLPATIVREFESIYLVSQVDIPSLRHAQRLSSHLAGLLSQPGKASPVQVVLKPLRRADVHDCGG